MRIAIHSLGTRGDVQPYIALARGLGARGHSVRVAAPEQYRALGESHGINYVPLPGALLALIDTPEGKKALTDGQGFGAGLKLLKHIRPLMRQLWDEEWRTAASFAPDVIVYHPKSIAAPHMAEMLGCASVLASPLPGFTPTAAFPSPLLPFASLGPLNRLSHVLTLKGAALMFGRHLRQWRASLGRSTGDGKAPDHTLYAYSRSVVPKPRDWNGNVDVTGYWFLDDPCWQMPPDLAAFLAKGAPPIYVGFGSMPGLEPEHMTKLVIDAVKKTGDRALIATGGGALSARPSSNDVHFITGAPHDRLFPHVKGVIHHGGAGTTGAALRAGKPMALCPHLGDQPFWARRASDLGVAPPPLRRKSLSVNAFATALAAFSDPAMRARAETLASAIAVEDGVETAATAIERLSVP